MILRALMCLAVLAIATVSWANTHPAPSKSEAEIEAHHRWLRSQNLHLAQSGPPPVQSAVLTSSLLHVDGALRPEFEEIFFELIGAENLDSLTLWNLAYVCRLPSYHDACAQHRVRQRLVAAAPDNAAVYLLPHYPSEVNRNTGIRLPEAQVLQAAKARHYDNYFGRIAHRVFELALEAVARNPKPALSAAEPLPSQAASIVFGSMYALPYYGPLFDVCEQAWQEDDPELLDACQAVSRNLQEQGGTVSELSIGAALERRILMLADPDSERALELWRQQRIKVKALTCLSQWVWPSTLERLYSLDIGQMLQQLGNLGELQFIEQWADKSHAEHPDWSERSPSECRALRELEGDALIAELGDSDPYELWLQQGENIRSAAAE